jgi:hypothetical protein
LDVFYVHPDGGLVLMESADWHSWPDLFISGHLLVEIDPGPVRYVGVSYTRYCPIVIRHDGKLDRFIRCIRAQAPETRPENPPPATQPEESPPPPATQPSEPAVADPVPGTSAPVAAEQLKKRPGPEPGTIDRFAEVDRALFPEMRALIKAEQLTRREAARRLLPKIAGRRRSSEESRIRRLANRYRDEVGN